MASASSLEAQPTLIATLESGDRLTRAEFERRYEALPHLKKAELIEGVVYVAPPVRLLEHGRPHAFLITWLAYYQIFTPGVTGGDSASVRLRGDNMVQPDGLLFNRSGQATVADDGIIEGAPDLVAEVAASSVSYDLHDKLHAYRRHGVREYVVWRVLDQVIDWFVLRDKRYQPLSLGSDGLYKSEVFPGLWLDPAALLRSDGARVIAVLQQGLATPEHAAFVARLQQT